MNLSQIAEVAYDTWSNYYRISGVAYSIPVSWDELSLEDQNFFEQTIKSLTDKVKNGDIGSMAIFFHNALCSHYLKHGYRHGDVHCDAECVTPYMLPFEELGKVDQAARFVFCSVVSAMQFAR